MNQTSLNIYFSNLSKGEWLAKIRRIHEFYSTTNYVPGRIVIFFDEKIVPSDLESVHLVTLACLIHFLISKRYSVALSRSNEKVFEYIFNDLGFPQYWSGSKNHVNARKSHNIFNLWRIIESEKELYARHIEEYLRNRYFKGKDMSAISVSLIEAFYNVFDHADAKGNAFSIIKYDEASHMLSVAISDFGIGIPTSVKKFDDRFTSDKDALMASLSDNFTVRSTTRNKGLGMGNILACADSARIFSNNGLIVKKQDSLRALELDIYFPGTLIYFEVDISSFDDEEILDSFNL